MWWTTTGKAQVLRERVEERISLLKCFVLLDLEGNGYVNRSQWVNTMTLVLPPEQATGELLEYIFDALDARHDGVVDEKEPVHNPNSSKANFVFSFTCFDNPAGFPLLL